MMINDFLNINPDIDLMTADLFSPEALAQYHWPDGTDRKVLLQSLRIRQRLLKIYPDNKIAATLESLGIHSAHHIASIGRLAFAQKAMPAITILDGMQDPKAVCAKIYANAERIRRASFELALAQPPGMKRTVADPSGGEIGPDFQKGIPDYQRLFGPMITCDCEECQSIFGPAAYFTDLMRVVTQYVTPPLEALFSLQHRRPDLWTMPLDCPTAETEVGYLDIVNGILQQNLRANYTGGTDPLKVLASMPYPFTAPFNQSLLKIRGGLEGAGASLTGMYKLLETTPPAAAAEMLNLSPEQLSLVTGSHAFSLAQLYGFHDVSLSDAELCTLLSDQRIFLEQTGLLPDQLEAMVYQNLKKGAGSYVMLDSGSQDITTEEFSDSKLTGSITIEGWIYPSEPNLAMAIMGKDTTQEFYIGLNVDGNQKFFNCKYRIENGQASFSSQAAIPVNEWTHIAWTRDGNGTNQIYINGLFDSSHSREPCKALEPETSTAIGIGYVNGIGVSSFQGGITELRLWSEVRTASQIQEMMYHRLHHYTETGLFAYWPLNESAGTTAKDLGRHHYNATGNYRTAFSGSVPAGTLTEIVPSLMHGLFLNNLLSSGQYISIAGPGDISRDEAQWKLLANPILTGLSDHALSQIAVYIRMQAQSGWAFEELDWLLKSVVHILDIPAQSTINDAIIESVGLVAGLISVYDIPIDELSSFWYDMKTYGRGNETTPKDLWDRVFNSPPFMAGSASGDQSDYYRPQYAANPLFSSPVLSWSFKDSANSQNQRVGNQLAAALNISAQDLYTIIQSITEASATAFELSVPQLSQFYRIARFAQMLNMSVPDFIQLSSITGVALTSTKLYWTITEVTRLSETAEWMKKWRLTIGQLTYLTSSVAPGPGLGLADPSSVNKVLGDMVQSSAQVMVTPALFISDRTDAAAAQAICNQLQASQVIDGNGVVLLNRSALTAAGIYEVLNSNPDVTDQIFPAGDERSCVSFTSAGSGKASFGFDPFADNTIQQTNCFTINAWVKPDTIDSKTWQQIIGHDQGGASDTQVSPTLRQVQGAGGDLQVCMSLEGKFYQGKVSNYFKDPAEWVYVSWVNDHGDWKVYRNGVPVPFVSSMATVPGVYKQSGPSPSYVFANGFNGSICNVSIWTIPRTATDIQLDMARCGYMHDADLLAFWPLDEGTGDSLNNLAENSEAVNGKLSGTYEWGYTDGTIAARTESLRITELLQDAFTAQNLLVVKTLAPVAGVNTEKMAGISLLTSGEIDNSSIFETPPYSPYPYSPNMLLCATPDCASSEIRNTFLAVLQRSAAVTRWFNLTAQEVGGIAGYSRVLGDNPISYGTRCWTLDQLMTLSDYKSLQGLCNETNGLMDYFRQANDSGTNTPSGSQLALLSRLTGWNLEELNRIVSQPYFGTVNFNTVAGLRKLASVMAMELKLGTGIATLNLLRGLAEENLFVDTQARYWQHYTDAATAITAMLDKKAGAKAIEVLDATLVKRVRGALCEWLIWELQTGISGVKNLQDLYEYLLIDVNMSPDVKTSWMVASMNSLQLYVNRIINNLEPGVINNIPEIWWEWMSTYRVWQANREVYLYPENYVDPSLRKFQSPEFKTFIGEVSKGQVTDENVKQALAHYLESVNEVASLELIDGYVEPFFLTAAAEPESNEKRAIQLIGRSRKEPCVFYFRTALAATSTAALDRGTSKDEATYMQFGPWQQINLQINSNYLSTVMAFGRQFIFWVEQTEIINTESDNRKYTSVYAAVYYSYRDFSGKWVAPVTFVKDYLVDIFGPAIASDQINYYESYLGGARLGNSQTEDKFYKARSWNQVGLQVLPATKTEGERILVTVGPLVSCPASMENPPTEEDTPDLIPAAAAYQKTLYAAAKRAYDCKGKVTTIIPAGTLSSAMEIMNWKLHMDSSNATFVNYATVPTDDKTGMVFYPDSPDNNAEIDNGYRAPDASWPMLMNMELVTGTSIKSLYTDVPGTFSAPPTGYSVEDPMYNVLNPVFFNGSLFATIPWDKYQGLAEFTVSCWVYLRHEESVQKDQNLLSLMVKNGNSWYGWDMSATGGKFQFGIGLQNGISTQIRQGTTEEKKWHFLALTVRSGNKITATVNDASYAYSIPYSPVLPSPSQQLTVGKSHDGNHAYTQLFGSLASLKLWKSPLSEQELQNEYNSRGVRPGNEQVRRLGNSAAGFLYNAQKQSYLVLPGFEAAVLGETLNATYDRGKGNLEVDFLRSPLEENTVVEMRMIRVNTDALPVLMQKLAKAGVNELLRPASQYLPEETPPVTPANNLRLPETNIMNFSGAFSTYFWEIFFYAPYFIAEKLRSAHKYPEAEKWYQYVFDPTNQATPVAYWPLNRMLMDQFPDMAGGEPAIPQNLTSTSENALPFSYGQREILTFTPSTDHPSTLSVATSKAFNSPEFTVGAWIKLKSLPRYPVRYAVVCSQSSYTGFGLAIVDGNASKGEWYVTLEAGSSTAWGYANSAAQVGIDKWFHVAGTYDGQRLRTFINGNLSSSAACENYACSSQRVLSIGSGNTWGNVNTNYFDGSIADVILFDQALSPGELKQMYEDYPQLSLNSNFWNFRPFRRINMQSLYHILNGDAWEESFFQPAKYYTASLQMAVYAYDPFDPDTLARLRINSWQKATFMRYLDNLLSWGDSLFTQDTWETLCDATMRYTLANTLLGRVPVRKVTGNPQPTMDYNNIEAEYGADSVPPFLIDMENQLAGLGADATLPEQVLSMVDAYFCIPPNKQLLRYWELVTDRLYKLRHGLSITGAPNAVPLYGSPIDPNVAVAAAATGGMSAVVASSSIPVVPWYRFNYMITQARSVTAEVLRLGSELLAALEKKDTEYLSRLQAGYQIVMNNFTAQIKASQINQLQYLGEGLRANLDNARSVHDTYQRWLAKPINAEEAAALEQLGDAVTEHRISLGVKIISVFSYLIPTVFGAANGDFNPGESLNATAGVGDTAGQILSMTSQLTSQTAQFHRRQEEWEMQLNVSANQIREIQAQITANNFALQAAQQEMALAVSQFEQSQEVYHFLKTKFTNEELYDWISGQLSTLYYQMFQLAWSLAQSTQTALQFELNLKETYLNAAAWDAGYQGLLAGDMLSLALQQMENAYISGHNRKLEIRKTWSMRQNNPQALLTLISTGSCRFDLNELSYDLDFPGHYNRKIKSLSITIPAVVGPYQNIHGTLVQTGNVVSTRPTVAAVEYLLGISNTAPSDGSLRINWNPNQEIIISTGMNDAGVFQINFNDEQYLPFEGTGAVSSWSLRIPQASNGFPLRSISDVIITVEYMAEDGGSTYASQVVALAPLKDYKGWQYISLRQLYSAAWFEFCDHPVDDASSLAFELLRNMYPANLDNDSIRLGNDEGKIALVPVMPEDYTGGLPDFTMNDSTTLWSAKTGMLPVSEDSGAQSVPGKGNPWILKAMDIPPDLLINDKLDQTKLLDIILVIPFSGQLSW